MKIVALLVVFAAMSDLAAAADAPAPASAAAAAAPVSAPASSGTVSRAQFTSGVRDREPMDKLTTLSGDKTQLYFYTELNNLAGTKVTHRWEYKNQVMSEQSFDVGSERWRVWSSKTLDPMWTGEWKVSVVDGSGATLAVQTLTYAAPAQSQVVPAAPK